MSQAPIASVSSEEIHDLTRILNTKHAASLRDRRFSIDVQTFKGQAQVTVTLANASESFYYPVEASLDASIEEISVRDAALFLIDYIAFYFEEFFATDESTYLPIDWADYVFEDVKLKMRGQLFNRERERIADQLLGEEGAGP
jgi:hypothetical protein